MTRRSTGLDYCSIISAGRPILVMTDFFDEGELTRGERRRGHAIQGLLIVALGIWTLSSG